MKDFILEVLCDEYCSFALKRRILMKIVPEFDPIIEQKINRMNTIRNYFAHCNMELFEVKDKKWRIPDPRNPSKSVDFASLYKEFVQIEPEVTRVLSDVFRGKGGELYEATPE